MTTPIGPRIKVAPGDLNDITRNKQDRVLDGFDKDKFDDGYDQINWKTNDEP